VIVHNLTIDWFRHRDGRPRLSALAASLPPLRRRIFEYVFLEQWSHVEAYELLRSQENPRLGFGEFLEELRATYRAATAGRNGRLVPELAIPAPLPAATSDPAGDDPAVRAEQRAILGAAMASLPPEDRLAVQLYVVDEMPAEQVARALGYPNSKTVYNRVYRALAAIRAGLEQAGIKAVICEPSSSNAALSVRTTGPMLQLIAWRRRVTCPAPDSLVPHLLGAEDPIITRHVEGCAVCQAELARLREAAAVLRAQTTLERRNETPECLDEPTIADFVEGRLTPEARAPLVAHLLTCANCRSLVRATGRLLAADAVAKESPKAADHRWRRWSLPVGLAAAAAVLLFVWPRSTEHTDSTPGLREPTPTSTDAPVPIAPRASVVRVDRFVWSSVPRLDRYRLRLYDDEGAILWTVETADTLVALPDSVVLAPRVTYFWKVEAQTEWRRWTASYLVEFRLMGSKR